MKKLVSYINVMYQFAFKSNYNKLIAETDAYIAKIQEAQVLTNNLINQLQQGK